MKWIILLVLVMLLLGSTMDPAKSGDFGKYGYIHTDIHPPFSPSSAEECDDYQSRIERAAKEINDAHSICLGESESNRLRGGECTRADCEELHVADDELREEGRKHFSECLKQIKTFTQKTRSSSYPKNKARIAPSKSSESSRSMISTISALSIRDRRQIRNIVRVTNATSSVSDLDNVRNTCNSINSVEARKRCYVAVNSMAIGLQRNVPQSALVSSIQKWAFAEIEEQHLEALEALGELERKIDQAYFGSNEQEGGWSDDW